MKLKLFVIVAFLFSINFCQAQSNEYFLSIEKSTDSLYKLYKTTTNTKEKDKLGKTVCHYLLKYFGTSISNDEQIELATKYKNDSTLLVGYGKKGFNASTINDYNTALTFLFKSLKICEKRNDTLTTGFLIREIAINYRFLKNYNQSLVYSKKAIDEINLYPDSTILDTKTFYYLNLSRVFVEMQLPDSAMNYIQIAAKLYEKFYIDSVIITDKNYKQEFESNFDYVYSSIYLQKKDTALAEVYFKKCFTVNPDSLNKFNDSYLQACINYSNFKKSQNNYATAITYAKIAYERSLKNRNKLLIATSSEMLYQLYSDNSKNDSAFYFLKINKIYNDSLNNAKAQSEIQNTTFMLHLNEQEKLENELEQKRKHQNNLQFSIIALGIVTLLLAFLLFSHSIIVGAKTIKLIGTVTLLIVFEFINLFIHPYLAHYTHESPILMLLILVLIALVLVPLHHKIEHWILEKLVTKNKKIRLENAKKTIELLEKE